jgi:hypothetical protein
MKPLSRLATIAALALLAATAGAQALRITPQGRQGEYDVYLVEDGSGAQATLVTEGPVTPEQQKVLLDLRDRVRSFTLLRVRTARVLFAAGAAQVLLVPAAYPYQGQDLAPFLPGGLRFQVDGTVNYDFRMLVGHYFLRMAGPFQGDEPLARRLAEAVATPAAFLNAETAGYLSDRFASIESKLQDVEGRGTIAIQDLETKVDALERRGGEALQDVQGQGASALKDLREARADIAVLKTDTAALKTDTAGLKSDAAAIRQEQGALRTDQAAARNNLDATKADLESLRAALLALPTAKLQADVEALQKALGPIAPDIESLRTAVVVMQSRSGLFGRRGVDKDAVARLVTLKRKTPALTQTDAAAALKAEGISMNSKDIETVFGIFFGQYK